MNISSSLYSIQSGMWSTGRSAFSTATSAARTADASPAESVENATTEQSTADKVEQVKKDFYQYLNNLPTSAGLYSTSLSVTITDAAFARMAEDPDFMQQMKDLCARDLCDPAWSRLPPHAMHITIDDKGDEDGYSASSWGSMVQDPTGADEESYWEKRSKRREEAIELENLVAKNRRQSMALLNQSALARQAMVGQGETAISLPGSAVGAYQPISTILTDLLGLMT
ncbi:MAG: hypothetical protein LIP23_01800 [Planctomycetes bacterium]|nr:hypothetical protein [Planctomycetota bacterium]